MDMDVTSRMSDATHRLRDWRSASKRSQLDRKNDRMRTRIDLLESALDQERDERKRLADALRRPAEVTVKRPRTGWILRTIVVAGAAYVAGTRAGREQYDRMIDWARERLARAEGARRSALEAMGDDRRMVAPESGPARMERTAGRVVGRASTPS